MFQAQGSDHVVVKVRPIFTSSHACKQQHWASPRLILLVATWQTSVRKSLKLAGYEKYTQPSAIYQAKYCLSTCQLLSWLCQTALGPFITPMKYFVVAGKPSWESESCGLGFFFFEHFFDVRVIHCFKGSKRIKKICLNNTQRNGLESLFGQAGGVFVYSFTSQLSWNP